MSAVEELIEQYDSAVSRACCIETLQLNLGLRCNMSCKHCHHRCSPERTEQMASDVLEMFLDFAEYLHPSLVDITGGAPELHPSFRDAVRRLRRADIEVQVRTNLAVLLEPGCEDLPAFFAANRVRLLGSLPSADHETYGLQRDAAAFEASIEAMRRLNREGYARSGGPALNLAVNPTSANADLPAALPISAMRSELRERFGVSFDDAVLIANMPLGRFADQLAESDELDSFVESLREHFNPLTLPQLACRSALEIAWDGTFSDCDFNLSAAMGLAAASDSPATSTRRSVTPRVPLSLCELARRDDLEVAVEALSNRRINFGTHCLACTAGAGSS